MVYHTSKLDQLEQLTRGLREIEAKRYALLDAIRAGAECPHPDFAVSMDVRKHYYSRNEKSWETRHYMCSICGYKWDDPSNEL